MSGSTDMAPYLSLSDQRRLRITLPPARHQKWVADILGSLDDKIDLNRRMNETLEAMARAVFRSWFVDFDPVRAKADGRKPVGMDAATAALFPDHFADSPLGPIPAGWTVGVLADVADVIMGASPPGDTYNDAGHGTPLINGPVEFGDRFPIKTKWTTAPNKLSRPHDLIFCVRGSTTGRRVIADDAYCLGRGVCSIRSRSGLWAFTHHVVDSEMSRLLARVTGSVFPNLNAADLQQFSIVIPPEPLRQTFQRMASPWLTAIAANVRQSVSLAAIRDALLPRLLSGELRVPEAEAIAEAIT